MCVQIVGHMSYLKILAVKEVTASRRRTSMNNKLLEGESPRISNLGGYRHQDTSHDTHDVSTKWKSTQPNFEENKYNRTIIPS